MRILFVASALLVTLAGCQGSIAVGNTGGGGGGNQGPTGLPCDVAELVAARCASCHGTTPSGGAPVTLLSRDDFMKASAIDATQTYGERSVTRMEAMSSTMPPGVHLAQAELDVMANWVAAGMPVGSCEPVDAGGTGGGSGYDGGGLTGLPCDVAQAVVDNCVSCHGPTPSGGAPVTLLSREDFLAASAVDATQSYGQRSVTRMQATTDMMPPSVSAPQSAIDAMTTWVAAGMPAGSCDSVDAGKIWPPDHTCLSGGTKPMPTPSDAHGSSTMAPGLACIACHSGNNFNNQNPGGLSEFGEIRTFMGTVFAAPHEKDLCTPSLPVTGKVQILAADSDTVLLQMSFGTSGNFYGNLSSRPATWRARVITSTGATRTMAGPQSDGDCNTCHTVDGEQNAPGRIYLPD